MPIFENLFRLLMYFFRCAKEIIMQYNLLQKYLFCWKIKKMLRMYKETSTTYAKIMNTIAFKMTKDF